MGSFGTCERNERGNRLTEFAEDLKVFIVNTLFQMKKNNNNKNTTNKKKQILDLGFVRWRNEKPNRFCIE